MLFPATGQVAKGTGPQPRLAFRTSVVTPQSSAHRCAPDGPPPPSPTVCLAVWRNVMWRGVAWRGVVRRCKYTTVRQAFGSWLRSSLLICLIHGYLSTSRVISLLNQPLFWNNACQACRTYQQKCACSSASLSSRYLLWCGLPSPVAPSRQLPSRLAKGQCPMKGLFAFLQRN